MRTYDRFSVFAGKRAARVGLSLVATLGLVSCGGHDDGTPTPAPVVTTSNTPPASASASVDGFIAFLKTLVPTQPETTEPLDVTAFVAPTIDTTEPDPTI